MVKTENVAYYNSDVENIRTKNNSVFKSIIISWKTTADTELFKILKYNNEDGGNSLVYTVENTQINSIFFQLRNERNEIITNTPDYKMVIQYNFYEKTDTINIVVSINKMMKEMYNTILFAINRLRLLL